MGLIAKYECSGCGFVTGELMLGRGMRDDGRNATLVSCASCKTLRVIDGAKVELGCRKHRRPFTIHEDEQSVPCPRCGAVLCQEGVALWD